MNKQITAFSVAFWVAWCSMLLLSGAVFFGALFVVWHFLQKVW